MSSLDKAYLTFIFLSSGKEYKGKVKKAFIVLLFTMGVSEVSQIKGNNNSYLSWIYPFELLRTEKQICILKWQQLKAGGGHVVYIEV